MKKHLFLVVLCCLYLGIDSNSPLQAQTLDEDFFDALEYRCIGPTRGGRATAVTGIPVQSGTFLMGSTGGGVWKTTDYGATWKNISDGYFATASIGAIRVSPSRPNIFYVGTGSDGIRSNVITGKGVYRSENSGRTWKHIGLENTGQIGAVEIDPNNPNRVFVAAIGNAFAPNAERGVYRTENGGKSWEKVLFVSDSTGAVDIEMVPGRPEILYASMWRAERKPWTIISGSAKEGGIYKSVDGGTTWEKLTRGLPQGYFGKSDLAVSPTDPNRLYALIEAPLGEGGVYRSDDQGGNFTLVNTKKELLDRPFYYCNIDADPKDPDVLYVNSTQFFKSTNGGETWQRLSTPHGDNHDIWISPIDTDVMVQANDGGVNISRDGGKNWSTQRNQPTAELYQVEVDDQFPYWIYAGQQDNSTIMLPSTPPFNAVAGPTAFWQAVGGCETGPVVPKPGNPNIVYANCKGRFGVYNKLTGQEQQYYVGASNMYGHNPKDLKFRFQRVAPIHVSPHNPDVVYHCSQYVHKTMDDGKTWEIISPDLTAFDPATQVISGAPITRDITGEEFYSTIYAIQESKIQQGVIWVGANDGPVHRTTDGGKTWENVTPKDLAPGGRIDCVEPSPHNPEKAYFVSLRYQLGDWSPYLYRTTDMGASWELLTTGENGIPSDYPIRVVREDPDREGLLYAGTEFGMFVSFDDGANWRPFQQNLPLTPITDIKVNREDLVVSTMGRSFWILDDLTTLHQFQQNVVEASAHLFKPRDGYRMRYRATRKSDIPYYPGPAILINYFLQEDAERPVRLEILNEGMEVIRAFVSNDLDVTRADQLDKPDMATGFFRQGSKPALNGKSGLHRFRWDMRHEGRTGARRSRGGPMVAPGTYFARLSVGDAAYTQSFKVLADPRIIEAGITEKDLLAQEKLALKVKDLQVEAGAMASEIKKALKVEDLDAQQKEKLMNLNKALSTQAGRYMQPMLVDQLSYLYNMLDRADQAPGKDALDRYEDLQKQFNSLKSIYDSDGDERKAGQDH